MIIAKNNFVIIKEYDEVKILSSELIVVSIKKTYYKIKGTDLKMVYYDRYEIRLTGMIKVIEYGL